MRPLVLTIGLLCAGGEGRQQVAWMKMEQAKTVAAKTGRPILVLVTVDPKTGNAVCGKSSGVDRAFQAPEIERRRDEFVFVRACDRGAAEAVKATRCLELVFLDCDATEVHRAAFEPGTLDKEMSAALKKRLLPRPVSWRAVDGRLPENPERPVVVVFVDERKDSADLLKALEEREVRLLHSRFEFVRAAWTRDAPENKRWSVWQAPAVLVLDPAKMEPVEKSTGRKGAREIRALLSRALAKLKR